MNSMGARYSHHAKRQPRLNKCQIPWLLRGAIRSNNMETLQYLLSRPHEVNPSMVIQGHSPVNLAIEYGHIQCVKMLIKAGCNLRQADAPRHPLIHAAIYGRPEIVELLLRSGCEVNACNINNENAIYAIAHKNTPKHIEVASLLVAGGIDVNWQDNGFISALHRMTHQMAVELLKSPKVNLNLKNLSGDTPLKCAIKKHDYELAEIILNKGCRIDEKDCSGMTSLMVACEQGAHSVNLCRLIVSKGCSLNLVDNQGMSALHRAGYCGHEQVCQIIIDNGSLSLNKQDKNGRTPLYLATSRGHTAVVEYLILLGADISIPNKEEKSALYVAAYFGHLEIVAGLLGAGADIDQSDSHNKTALYVATYHGRTDIVNLLIRNNARVNICDKNGKSPLYIAVLHGNLQIAESLIRGGANVNWPDKDGLVPLHMAVKFPKLDIPMVKLLLSAGCDPLNLYSFTQWLLTNNIIPDDCITGDAEFNSWLQLEKKNVACLRRLCRTAIQTALGQPETLRARVRELPIPNQLQNYLSLKPL